MEGLDKFREAFEAYSENYVIIGGTACDIAMTGTAVRPRATHDIDMIVIVEKMTTDFAEHFWQFVREGGYRPERRKQEEGETPKYELYRFVNGKPDYPEMIELLSRHPDILGEPRGLTIEPIPTSEDTSSLSAIIMDDDFYHFTIEHSKLTNGLRHADSAALIALKSRAYLNLLQDKANGKHVNSKDIKKHRSDVLKLVAAGIYPEPVEIEQKLFGAIQEFATESETHIQSLADALGVDEDAIHTYIGVLRDEIFKQA